MNGIIILPTMGRPHNIERFIQAYRDTKAVTPVLLVLDAGDSKRGEYELIILPPQFSKIYAEPGTSVPNCQNIGYAINQDKDFYGLVGDDCVPESDHWDVILGEACMPNKIAWGDDELQRTGLVGHPFVGGELIRKMGYIAHPAFNHYFTDTVLRNIVVMMNCGIYFPDVKMPHYHHMNGRAPMDETYSSKGSIERDHAVYDEFNRTEFPNVIARLKA